MDEYETIGSVIDDVLEYDHYTMILTGAGQTYNQNEKEFDRIVDGLTDTASVTAHKYTVHQYDRDVLDQQDIFEYDFGDDDILCIPAAHQSRQPRNHTPVQRYEQYLEQIEETDLEAILFMDVDSDIEQIDPASYTENDLIVELKRRWAIDLIDIEWSAEDTSLLLATSYER